MNENNHDGDETHEIKNNLCSCLSSLLNREIAELISRLIGTFNIIINVFSVNITTNEMSPELMMSERSSEVSLRRADCQSGCYLVPSDQKSATLVANGGA